MSYSESLMEFPHALDIITELQLSKDIQEVPPWVKGMSRLRVLRLYDCNNLVSLPQLSNSLSWIDANNCKSLERMDCCFNNPKIRLQFANCFKLNQEARDLIMHTSTSRYTMLPGTQIPACFNHRATAGEETRESSTLVWINVVDKQNDLKSHNKQQSLISTKTMQPKYIKAYLAPKRSLWMHKRTFLVTSTFSEYSMGSVMSLSSSKRKATSQDVESVKRQKICLTNRVVNVAAAAFTKFRFQQDNKDTISSVLALPSPPTSVSRIWKHHVFPSFHGEDVRKTILSHILESFRRKGIDTFSDNNIERSKSIGLELKEAIRGSKIAIVLLSKNYASSSWCLDELAEIMKCRELLGQIVMTIFYEVDPTDIKKQTGDFGKAFKKTCNGKTKEHVERWRKALEDVATITGEHSRNWRNEAAMIEKIATNVSNMLNSCTPSRDFDGLVGMRAHMDRMEHLLRLDLDEVRMIGIWGPPGIGKTTIARFLFNQVSDRFQLSAIIVNIRGIYPRLRLDEYSAQMEVQQKMLSTIFSQKDIIVPNLGVAQERLKDKKVFLVLDEVDHIRQLDALAKETRWFGPGSRIIITTEDVRVLNAHRINHVYKVKFPSSDEAFQIFCMNAFGQKQPHEGFCSALRGMSKPEWERTLPKIKYCLDGEIKSIIKFSFDALCDEDKDLFLYIACFFNGIKLHKVEGVLAKKFLDVRQSLHVLVEKSLISINQSGLIETHTVLKQFGRETSRKQLVHGFAKPQFLVDARDICEVLNDDTIAFYRDYTEEELSISEKALERMHDFQFVRINAFAHPERLHSLLHHSQKIRLLHWSYLKDICLPCTFNPEFLVELGMYASKLHKLWEGTRQLQNLRWMDLCYSRDLTELPDLSTATNLEDLILRNCSSLVRIPCSIENATNLQILDLSDCSNLVELPSIGNATRLEELNLNNCSSLVKLLLVDN
uniref:RPP1-EstH n=2 Tax=Arabidopsis thaliana TaxID=3702 RepID=A0A0S2RR89_ARATH|nr:RPP1-EstH [Arabidopsis thaliana]